MLISRLVLYRLGFIYPKEVLTGSVFTSVSFYPATLCITFMQKGRPGFHGPIKGSRVRLTISVKTHVFFTSAPTMSMVYSLQL